VRKGTQVFHHRFVPKMEKWSLWLIPINTKVSIKLRVFQHTQACHSFSENKKRCATNSRSYIIEVCVPNLIGWLHWCASSSELLTRRSGHVQFIENHCWSPSNSPLPVRCGIRRPYNPYYRLNIAILWPKLQSWHDANEPINKFRLRRIKCDVQQSCTSEIP